MSMEWTWDDLIKAMPTVKRACSRYFQGEKLEDAAQSSLIRIWVKRSKCEAEDFDGFRAWSSRVAVNWCLDGLRKGRGRVVYFEEQSSWEGVSAELPGPEERLVARRTYEAWLDRCPLPYRVALMASLTPGGKKDYLRACRGRKVLKEIVKEMGEA